MTFATVSLFGASATGSETSTPQRVDGTVVEPRDVRVSGDSGAHCGDAGIDQTAAD